MRITFLIRQRQLPGTALQNAAAYDAEHLRDKGHAVQVLAIPEGDTLPTVYRGEMDLTVIEGAGWVPAKQIKTLVDIGVRVIVRVHAAPEFLYYEFPGVCTTDYIAEARAAGATVAFVSEELAVRFAGERLPIAYPKPTQKPWIKEATGDIHVGCFGSIRPLKNHLGEVMAIARARSNWYKQRDFFMHINSTRIEGTGFILNELKACAKAYGIHLVSHHWMDTETFKSVAIQQMTVGLFGTYAESFCLTAADFVSEGIPCVLSSHIPWVNGCATDVRTLATALLGCISEPNGNAHSNYLALKTYCEAAGRHWNNCLEKVGNHVLVN